MFSGSEQACVQYVLRLIILITIARLKGLNIFGKREERKLLALRGLFGALTMIFMNFSLKLITPSDSVALMHTNIVFISILARFFLKEKFSLMDFIILILTVIGKLEANISRGRKTMYGKLNFYARD
jgi:drug/metabolite transporter (DMT)-like permease